MVSDLWLYKSIYLLFAQQPYFEMSPSITPALGCVTLCIAVALNKQQRGDLGPEVRACCVFSVSPVILSSLLDIGCSSQVSCSDSPFSVDPWVWNVPHILSHSCHIPAILATSPRHGSRMWQSGTFAALFRHICRWAFSVDSIVSWMVMGTRNLGNFFESWKIQEQVVLSNGGHCFVNLFGPGGCLKRQLNCTRRSRSFCCPWPRCILYILCDPCYCCALYISYIYTYTYIIYYMILLSERGLTISHNHSLANQFACFRIEAFFIIFPMTSNSSHSLRLRF